MGVTRQRERCARIGTPQRPSFFWLRTARRSHSFAEHVFYPFDRDKIAQVWSLLDRQAIATQTGNR